MFIISLNLTWKVLEQYKSKATSFQVFQEEIIGHPTITMCFEKWREDGTEFKIKMEYEKNFDIKIYLEEESSLHLQLGINYYNNSTRELVYFDKISSTHYSGTCYNITSILKIRKGKQTQFAITFPINTINFADIPPVKLYFTSKSNAFGIIGNRWLDGDEYDVTVSRNTKISLNLRPIRYIYDKQNSVCRDISFYECYSSKLIESIISGCPKKCMPCTVWLKSQTGYPTLYCKRPIWRVGVWPKWVGPAHSTLGQSTSYTSRLKYSKMSDFHQVILKWHTFVSLSSQLWLILVLA